MVIITVVIAGAMFLIGWLIGRSAPESELSDMTIKYERLTADYEKLKAEQESDSKAHEDILYSKNYWIRTYHTPAIGITLAKGDTFQVRMYLYKAIKDKAVEPTVDGSILFWVYDPLNLKVVDAGRISGFYEFSLDVEETGNYEMVFTKETDECVIFLEYNCPSDLWNASISVPFRR